MDKSQISVEILQQLEKLAKEASRWAKDMDSNEIDPTIASENNWAKQRNENRQLFKFQPLP